jgi:hypothetical protein
MSASAYTTAVVLSPRRRRQRAQTLARRQAVIAVLCMALPVPAFAATGLSLPIPNVVERVAAALVPFAEPAEVARATSVSVPAGTIVLTDTERSERVAQATAPVPELSPAPPLPRTQARPQPKQRAAKPHAPKPAQTAAVAPHAAGRTRAARPARLDGDAAPVAAAPAVIEHPAVPAPDPTAPAGVTTEPAPKPKKDKEVVSPLPEPPVSAKPGKPDKPAKADKPKDALPTDPAVPTTPVAVPTDPTLPEVTTPPVPTAPSPDDKGPPDKGGGKNTHPGGPKG